MKFTKWFLAALVLVSVTAHAQDIPEKGLTPPGQTQPQDSQSPDTPDQTTTASPAPSPDQPADDDQEESKPASPCQDACMGHKKTCFDHCKAEDSDTKRETCEAACMSVFASDGGYCFGRCVTDEKFLTPCKTEDDTMARSGDECLDGCEDHYGACVMGCRDKFKDKSPRLKGCYQDCTTVFAEVNGFCKSQCDLEPGFMQECE